MSASLVLPRPTFIMDRLGSSWKGPFPLTCAVSPAPVTTAHTGQLLPGALIQPASSGRTGTAFWRWGLERIRPKGPVSGDGVDAGASEGADTGAGNGADVDST